MDCCSSAIAIQVNDETGGDLQYVSRVLQRAIHNDVLSFVHAGRLY